MTLSDVLAQSAADGTQVQFGVLDERGRLLFVNTAWQRFGERVDSGIRPVELDESYVAALTTSEDSAADAIMETLDAVLTGDTESAEITYSHPRQAGTYRFQMQANQFWLDEKQYVAVTHTDVTGREQSKRDLARFRKAIESAGHAIFITNTSGEITYVNPAFEEITGYDSTDALGETPRIMKSGEMGEAYYERLWKAVLSGDVWEELIINRRKSGELYYAHQTIAPVLEADGTPAEFVALQTDVTELRATRQGTENLGRLLRHDLRNELSIVQSYAELITLEGGEVAEYAEKIVSTLSALLETTEKGIELQRFLSQTYRPTVTDAVELVDIVVSKARRSHPAAEITYTAPDTATALCLPELEVALLELVENAVVHNDSDTPTVDLSLGEPGGWVEIRIADNGPGTPAMEYEALDSSSSALSHDTGFGINLAYWIVRRSGGRLEFEEVESGTTICICLSKPATE